MITILTGWTVAEDCRATPVGLQYTGRINVTSSGRTCQRWDVDSPHRASTCARDMPDAEVSHAQNYCRNPDYSTCKKAMPWCYTTDSKTTWEYCYIPECGEKQDADILIYLNLVCFILSGCKGSYLMRKHA